MQAADQGIAETSRMEQTDSPIPPAPRHSPTPMPTTESEAEAMTRAGMLWLQQHAPRRLAPWLAQQPIGRVMSKAEQGEGYDPQQKVIHFPGGHPPEGTNLYAAPQASDEALQVLKELRTEMHAALQAGKLAPDAISTALVKRWSDVLRA
jgi:hypothetical protein